LVHNGFILILFSSFVDASTVRQRVAGDRGARTCGYDWTSKGLCCPVCALEGQLGSTCKLQSQSKCIALLVIKYLTFLSSQPSSPNRPNRDPRRATPHQRRPLVAVSARQPLKSVENIVSLSANILNLKLSLLWQILNIFY